jgi:hypothetical protein
MNPQTPFPPYSPFGSFLTSDPHGIPVDRRPLRLGMYLHHQTFSPSHRVRGGELLTRFKSARYAGWAGAGAMVFGGFIALVPELLDASQATCMAGWFTGGTTALGGTALQFISCVQQDEISAEMETEFNTFKGQLLVHNKTADPPLPVPYLADPSLSERLAEAHIANTGASATNTASQVPSNLAMAGIALEALKTIKSVRKS